MYSIGKDLIVDRTCIKQTFINNAVPSGSNIFHNPSFEATGTYQGYRLLDHWKFINYRLELVSGTNVKFANLDCIYDGIVEIKFQALKEIHIHIIVKYKFLP